MSHLRLQALIAVSGIILLGALLGYLGFNVSTVSEADYGGTYVEGVAGQPNIINPLYSQFNTTDRDLVALIYDGLTAVDESNTIQPDLARSWAISPDGLIYTFTLRSDVKWSDGAPFSADDVLYTIQSLQSPDYAGPASLSALWRTVAVNELDQYTVRFQLTEPFAPFLESTTIGILPSHMLQDVSAAELARSEFNRKPVGTGPFALAELNSDHALLRVNARYFGPQPFLDTVVFRFYPDFESALAAYQKGQVEGLAQIDLAYLPRARQNRKLNLYSARTSGYNLVFMNLARPVFQDPQVRQALLYATDRARIVNEILQGQGLVAPGPILPDSWAYDPAIKQYPYDPVEANALLTAAGWITDTNGIRVKDKTSLSLSLLTNDDPVRVAIANELAAEWAALGILAQVKTVPTVTLVQEVLRPRQFDAVLFGFAQLPSDPDPYPLWDSSQMPERNQAGQNYGGWENREADAALEAARRETDQARRAEQYVKFQQIFSSQVPALLLYYPVYTYAVDSSVHGVQVGPLLTPSDRFRRIEEWYVKTRRVILSESPHTPVP